MGANSKQKGSAFEREICKALALWISDGERKDVFWRSATSGGRATIALTQGDTLSAQAGDISAVHELGHKLLNRFYIECKFYKDLEVGNLIFGTHTGTLYQFIDHVTADAKRYSKHPMLIVKQNQRPTLMIIDAAGYDILGCKNYTNALFYAVLLIQGTTFYIGQLHKILAALDPKYLELT